MKEHARRPASELGWVLPSGIIAAAIITGCTLDFDQLFAGAQTGTGGAGGSDAVCPVESSVQNSDELTFVCSGNPPGCSCAPETAGYSQWDAECQPNTECNFACDAVETCNFTCNDCTLDLTVVKSNSSPDTINCVGNKASCDITCGASCVVSCEAGASCEVSVNGTASDISCQGEGTTCALDCALDDCGILCSPGATCEVTCPSGPISCSGGQCDCDA